MFSLWDALNLIYCIFITAYVAKTFKFSDRVILILVFHVILIFFIDIIFDPHYWGDQFRYYAVAMQYRDGSYISEIGTVAAAGKIMALFPVFIDSYKSIGFGNYLLYLFLYVFILTKLSSAEIVRLFKIVYLTYPSMTLYSTLGLRDFIILTLMFISLYCIYYYRNPIILSGMLWLLFSIKGQNALLFFFVIILLLIESVRFKLLKTLLYGLFIFSIVWAYRYFQDALLLYRNAMFYEDMRMVGVLAPDWTPLDLYRYFFAPFFFDARNAMQILQSCENVFLIWMVYKILKIRKKITDVRGKHIIDNFFLLSGVMYSYVVFNYGTITRYKFPFIVCWILINLIMIDKAIVRNQGNIQ